MSLVRMSFFVLFNRNEHTIENDIDIDIHSDMYSKFRPTLWKPYTYKNNSNNNKINFPG